MKDLKRPYIMEGEPTELHPDTYGHADVKALRRYAFRLEAALADKDTRVTGAVG